MDEAEDFLLKPEPKPDPSDYWRAQAEFWMKQAIRLEECSEYWRKVAHIQLRS